MGQRRRGTGRRSTWGVRLSVAGGLLLAACGWLWLSWRLPARVGGEGGRPARPSVTVRISQGATLRTVADTLAARGLLRQKWFFVAYARHRGADRRVQAGTYVLPARAAPRDLLAALVTGRSLPQRVTLPEGGEADQFASLVAAALDVSPERFLAAADSLARAGVLARGLMGDASRVRAHDEVLAATTRDGVRSFHWCEGYLAPDTYFFAPGTPASEAARVIVETGLARAEAAANAGGLPVRARGLSTHELVTLASIVEAEARLEHERPLIAAVYLNRLRAGWRLDADPTVAYALDRRGERLYYHHLDAASPYNTYRHGGLPPGPIGNPGQAALAAVARPDTGCRALFFVADGRGGHVFSRTATEHARAVAAYRSQREAPPPDAGSSSSPEGRSAGRPGG